MSRTLWHPAFFGAIKLELAEYRHVLEFESEHQLTTEPLKIDVVIVKKRRNIMIKKNIARIFQKYNIVEYKSPSISVSIRDYYKTQAYGWLSASFNRIDIKDMSLTIVATKHPLKLLNNLKDNFGIDSIQNGIYRVKHTSIATQIVVSSELSESENLWLASLNNGITITRLKQVTTDIASYEHDPTAKAYFDVVVGANFQTYLKLIETQEMKTLTQHLQEMGIIDQLLAQKRAEIRDEVRDEVYDEVRDKVRAEERQANQIETARKLKYHGMDRELIMEITGLSLKEVKRLR
ncbi:MAG: hypothetical protein LBT09_03895 [Planctomycetaceae bacterium]|jgi:hypothetical protein|nr:hypothetical protein [Planctomycetaceae bacterium]